jgi:two-component system, NarL family, invasion response regulator UvrY
MEKKPKILHIDDHPLMLFGVESVFLRAFPNGHLCSVENVVAALEKLNQIDFDIIILDLQLDAHSGLEGLEKLHREYPDVPILAYTYLQEDVYGLRVIEMGGKGFLSKLQPQEKLLEALEMLLSGKPYLSEHLKQKITNLIVNKTSISPFDKLSAREFEIVQLTLKGQGIKEICNRLNLKPSTVSTFKAKAFLKLKVENTMELKEIASLYGF